MIPIARLYQSHVESGDVGFSTIDTTSRTRMDYLPPRYQRGASTVRELRAQRQPRLRLSLPTVTGSLQSPTGTIVIRMESPHPAAPAALKRRWRAETSSTKSKERG